MSVSPIEVAVLGKQAWDQIDNVKVYQRRCRNLVLRCNLLISALREDDTGTSPSPAHEDALNDAQAILESVRERVGRWGGFNTVRSLLNQSDIREGVDELHRRVDSCIDACHVRISRQMAQVQREQSIAAHRDNLEIQERMQNLMGALSQYMSNQHAPPRDSTFQAVIHDIQEETRDVQSLNSTSSQGDSRSFESQGDAFNRAMRSFCKSLVNLELAQPPDVIVPARPTPESPHSPYRQPPARRRSLTNLWRSSSVSVTCPQLPPLDFGEEDTVWHDTPFMPTTPSPSRSSRRSTISGSSISSVSSMSSRTTTTSGSSGASGTSTISRGSRGSTIARGSSHHSIMTPLERQRTERSSVLNMPNPSGPLSPLKQALTSPKIVWKSSGQPRVITKATMEGFIHYLLQTSAEEDPDQHNTFFVAFPAFVTPLIVLGMLIRRFDNATMYPDEECHDIQTRVMGLIRDWLRNEYVIVADEVLAEMRNFVGTVNDSDCLDELVLEVVQGIRLKASMRFPLSPFTSSFNPVRDKAPSAYQLAIALARLERERYQRILPMEYMAYAGKLPPYCPNLTAVVSLNMRVETWVQSCILDMDFDGDPDELEKRSEVKRFFVKTAKECQKIRNFSSAGTIMNALLSEDVACLVLTHDCMSLAERQEFDKLQRFLKPDSNYTAYRNALSKSESKGCIPWQVVHLHDVHSRMQGERDVEDHNPPLINFEKWIHLKAEAMFALRHRDVPYAPVEEYCGTAMEYLKKGLQGVTTGDRLVLRENSARLKENEDHLRRRVMAERQARFGGPR